MMMSTQEKKELREELLQPGKADAVFAWAIKRWCEDYSSRRSGVIALQDKVYEDLGVEVPFTTLRPYVDDPADGTPVRSPQMSTAYPVLHVILGEK